MPNSSMFRLNVCFALLLAAPSLLFAEPLIRPVPVPDTSKLAAPAAKDLTETRTQFDKVRTGLVGPPLAQAYADMGALYARAGFKDAAVVAFYDATQVNPQDSRWLYLYGVLARDLKQIAQARSAFEAAMAIDSVYLPIRYRLADTLVDQGDLDSARKLLQTLVHEHADQPVLFAMLGQLSLKQKRYPEAIQNLSHALELDPKANELYKGLAEAYTGQGNAQAAQDARAKAGDNPPSLADPLVTGMYHGISSQLSGTPVQQAQELARQGHIDAARGKLAQALQDKPDDVEAIRLSARIEGSMGNVAIANLLADQAIKLSPDNADAWLTRGMVDELGGDDAKAYAAYEKAVRADAKSADARQLLGNAQMRRGQYPLATEQYRQLIGLQPENTIAYARLIAAEVADGKCANALKDINAALAKHGKDGDLMQIFVRVASTCAASSQQERDMALDYATALYKQRPDGGDSTALAIALAAHGKFEDAQQYQAAAIFQSIKDGDNDTAAIYKTSMQAFVAKQAPDKPWPAAHPYFKPPMLKPVAATPAATPAPAAKQG